MADTAIIYAVDTVDLSLVKAGADTLVACATGRTVSTGWHSGELALRVHVVPPADGVLDADFYAARPAAGSVVAPVLTPIVAQHTFNNADVANFWGPGRPLTGLRVHAETNAKVAMLAASPGMPGIHTYSTDPPQTPAAPSFAVDIMPKFRPRDVNCMMAISGFNLHDYGDVKSRAQAILGRLSSGSMPTDGPWPPADVDLFKLWTTTGMAA